ncbi:hypothetical protein [Oricola nitratireducens]|jgi:hypothetical protein|uniref:hypothetical protein n=1 Tax=Oricola nitratireducens TaxID=2775868 RepID=UPI001867FC80|nr:hypothetical protein [Oricola nitratireducens]
MIRLLFRTLALVCFAIAVMFVVVDATRSIGVSELVFTPFAESFELAAPQLLESFRAWFAQNAPEFVTGGMLATALGLPTFAVFAGFAFVFYVIGRKPRLRGLQRLKR